MPRLPAVLLLSLLTWTATAGALTLSDDERGWLADHQELSLGVDASWPPFEYRDESGRYQGLSADYVRLIQDRLGVRIEDCAILEDSPVGASGAVASGGYVIGMCMGTHCAVGHDQRLREIGVSAIAWTLS